MNTYYCVDLKYGDKSQTFKFETVEERWRFVEGVEAYAKLRAETLNEMLNIDKLTIEECEVGKYDVESAKRNAAPQS